MEIQLEVPTATKKVVNVSIPSDTVSEALSKEYQKIRKKASVKGFRKGKVPLHIIKSMYGDSAKYEVLNKLINDSLSKAISDNNIQYVGDPVVKDVSDLKEGEELKITAEFDCIEEFEIKDYKGLEIEVEKIEATEEMYDNAIRNVLERFTYFEDVEDENIPIEKGFQVVAEIEAFVNGEKDEALSKDEIILTIGNDYYLPGFDDYFIGLTKNDETEVNHTFTKDNETVEGTFKIKIKWIKKPVVPELDEDFVAQFGEEYKDVEDFKNKIKDEINENFKMQMRDKSIEQILEKLREDNKFEIPQILIEKQIEFNKKNMQKLPDEDDEAFNKRVAEYSEKQVRNSILLDKIEKLENIKVEQADFDKEFERLAKQFRAEPQMLKEFYMKNNEHMQQLYSKLLTDKTFDFLLDNAKINYIEKKEESVEGSSEEEIK